MSVFFQLLGQGIRDLFRVPWSLCMTIAAITLVSFLGGAFLLLVHNLDLQIGGRQGNVQFQVYWNQDIPAPEIKEIWATLSSAKRSPAHRSSSSARSRRAPMPSTAWERRALPNS